jgi:hypothetical protein
MKMLSHKLTSNNLQFSKVILTLTPEPIKIAEYLEFRNGSAAQSN